jgi:uncharacterized protein YggE
MKLTRLAVLVVAACMALATLVLVQAASARSNVGSPVRQGATGHTITVAGHGEIQMAPDMATITVGVQTHDSSAQAALSSNASKMNAVIAAVEAQGVPATHVQTSDLSLWYDSQKDQYVVSHSLTVRSDSPDEVGTILDAAVAAGANTSWGVSFGLKDQNAAEAQALTVAVSNARTRAQAIAGALGVSISGVGSASEATYNIVSPQPLYARAAAAGPVNSTPVQTGQLTVSADINVVYTFG